MKDHKLRFFKLTDSLLISSHSCMLANSILIVRSGLVFCAFTNLLNVYKIE